MRIQRTWLLFFTILLVPLLSAGDKSPRWDDLLLQAETAEAKRDCKKAEDLLRQACAVSAARLSAATPQRVACIRLAQLYELQGKWNKASKVLDQLLERLQALGSSQPLDIVEALLARAEVQAARSRFDSATTSLQDVVPFLSELIRPQRSRALARMSEFYLATNNRTVGTRLLKQAQAELEAEQDLDGAEYVAAATDVAAVLRWYGRGSESMKILEPIVAHTRSRFA